MKRLISLLLVLAYVPFASGIIWIQPSRFTTGGGPPAWAYTIASGSLTTNESISTTVFDWQPFTAQAGATTKLSLYVRGFTYTSGPPATLPTPSETQTRTYRVGTHATP